MWNQLFIVYIIGLNQEVVARTLFVNTIGAIQSKNFLIHAVNCPHCITEHGLCNSLLR
jgi:hypothetical protein